MLLKFVSRLAASSLVLIAFAAIAKIWPFPVAAAGPQYAQTTYAIDMENEYQAANTIANTYMALPLSDAAKKAKIMANDFVRIVYYDGQIADFKIKRFPSFAPLTFDSKVPTVTTPHLSQSQLDDIDRRNNTCVSISYSISYDTGYWGQDATYSNDGSGDLSHVTVTAFYVSTGSVSRTFSGLGKACQYR